MSKLLKCQDACFKTPECAGYSIEPRKRRVCSLHHSVDDFKARALFHQNFHTSGFSKYGKECLLRDWFEQCKLLKGFFQQEIRSLSEIAVKKQYPYIVCDTLKGVVRNFQHILRCHYRLEENSLCNDNSDDTNIVSLTWYYCI